MAIAKPPETMVPVEAVDDVASPLAPKVAIPLTDNVLPRLAAPDTPIVVPTYNALAIAAPPAESMPPETLAEDASPGKKGKQTVCKVNQNGAIACKITKSKPIKTYQKPKTTQCPIQPKYCLVKRRQ